MACDSPSRRDGCCCNCASSRRTSCSSSANSSRCERNHWLLCCSCTCLWPPDCAAAMVSNVCNASATICGARSLLSLPSVRDLAEKRNSLAESAWPAWPAAMVSVACLPSKRSSLPSARPGSTTDASLAMTCWPSGSAAATVPSASRMTLPLARVAAWALSGPCAVSAISINDETEAKERNRRNDSSMRRSCATADRAWSKNSCNTNSWSVPPASADISCANTLRIAGGASAMAVEVSLPSSASTKDETSAAASTYCRATTHSAWRKLCCKDTRPCKPRFASASGGSTASTCSNPMHGTNWSRAAAATIACGERNNRTKDRSTGRMTPRWLPASLLSPIAVFAVADSHCAASNCKPSICRSGCACCKSDRTNTPASPLGSSSPSSAAG